MTVEYFTKLFDHMEWADRRTLASLRAMAKPPDKRVELFAHILGAESVWLSRINSTTSPVPVWPSLNLGEAERLLTENVEGYKGVLSSLTDEGLQRPIAYTNSAGDRFTSTIEDMLTQVATHGAYHRGQIAAAVRAAGGAPNPTDYIAFIRGTPAATRQE